MLSDSGYQVTAVSDRQQIMYRLQQARPDLTFLDTTTGRDRETTFTLCRDVRRRWPQLPILLIVDDTRIADFISGYRLGADDCLAHNVDPMLLVARVQTLLERIDELRRACLPATRLLCDDLTVDMLDLTAVWRQRPVKLSLQQLRMLAALIEEPGHVVSIGNLMQASGTRVTPNTITANINRMRKRFEASDPQFNHIQNIHGQGYRWAAASA